MPLVSRIPEVSRQVTEMAAQLAMAMGRAAYSEAKYTAPVETAALMESLTIDIRDTPGEIVVEVRTHGSQAEHLSRLGRELFRDDYTYALYVRDRVLGGPAVGLEPHQGFMEQAALATWDTLPALVPAYAKRAGLA